MKRQEWLRARLEKHRKYQWRPLPAEPWRITAGFDFLDPILMDQKKLIQFTRIKGIRCAVYQGQTSSSLYWKEGDPVEPVYFAEGLCDGKLVVFYDKKSVHAFQEYILNKPPIEGPDVEDILMALYEVPEE